jgi:hypothetical protein
MNERDLAERFNQDVDRLLNAAGRTDAEPLPAEYRQALDVARRLASTDFSPESRSRLALRRRLLSRMDAREHLRKEKPMRTYPQLKLRRPLYLAISIALALLLAVTFLIPGGPAVAAYNISTNVKLIMLGAYSRAQQIEATVTGKPMPDDSWHVELFRDVGFAVGFGGGGPPGTNPEVRSVTTLEEAQEIAAFDIRVLKHLPEGYALREIKLAPVWTGPAALVFPSAPSVFLFYGGLEGDIVVVEQPVGTQSSDASSMAVGTFTSFMTNGTLEEVDFNGRTAAWADSRLLMWEEDGIGYTVGGSKVRSLEEVIRIAESLK